MGQKFRVVIAALIGVGALAAPALAQNDPPGRIARLAFTEGTVSFHDDEQSDWTRAAVNTPLTTGDSIWTEAGARSEISLAGTRVRLDGGTQLDLLAIDDTQTRMQVAQGRVDIKTFTLDTNTPYQIVTPRGTISLNQQGDYYVEAGSTQDATRLGVRSGAATFTGLNGQALAVRAGEVAEVSGNAATPQLHTINTPPPPMPTYWAERDRTVSYDAPQYVNAGMTGYEDLNANGTWANDPEYGQVWSPRSVPSGWEPYRTGHWQNVRPWGWTWVDDQPWGFAPYHYGRWANRNNRWVWVPPQRDQRPVYAPALVAFIGGIELSISLGNPSRAPVGWFPLAPREAYVPPYTTNQNYYRNVNRSDRIEQAMLNERWQRAQSREAMPDRQRPDQQRFVLANQRFATVVAAEDFVRSRPVARATIQVAPEKLAAAPVARVSAPLAPTQSVNAAPAPAANAPAANAPAAKPTDSKTGDPKTADPKAADPKAQADAKAEADAKAKTEASAKASNVPVTQTQAGGMATLGKPADSDRPKAPGPKVASRPNEPAAAGAPAGTPQNRPAAAPPPLQPRIGNAPPELKGDKTPAAPAKPSQPEAKAPAANDNKATTAPTTPQPQPPVAAPPAAKAEPAKPAPNVATPAAPATPATPAPKPEATKPAPAPAQATPARPEATPARPEPQPAQRPQQDREENRRGTDNRAAPPPSQPAPAQQAAPHVTPPPAAPPAHAATPAPTPAPAPAAAPPQQAAPAQTPAPAATPPKPPQEAKPQAPTPAEPTPPKKKDEPKEGKADSDGKSGG